METLSGHACKMGSAPASHDGAVRLKRYLFPLALLVMTALGFALRLPGSGLGFWRDEMHVYCMAHLPSISEMWQTLGRFEGDPPLPYLIMWTWVHLTGGNDALFTLPLMVCGLALIPAAFFLCRVAHSRLAGIVAAATVTVAPAAVYWSQEMRPYQLGALLTCVMLTFYFHALDSGGRKYLVLFTLAGIALSYTHYTCLMFLGILFGITVVLWLLQRRKILLCLIACFAVMGIAFLPCLAYLPWVQAILGHIGSGSGFFDSARPSLWQTPLIFFTNIADSMPVPPQLSAAVTAQAASAPLVLLLLPLAAGLLWGRLLLLARTKKPRFALAIMFTCFLVEACLVQVVTPYQTSRYLYPVMPLCWCVISCIIVYCLHEFRGLARDYKLKLACVAIALGLSFIAINAYSDCNDARGYRSGVEAVVVEASSAKPEVQLHTAFLIIPDFNSATFDFYAGKNDLKSQVHGVPRWDDLSPYCHLPEIGAEFTKPDFLSGLEDRIAELASKQHITQLLLVCDRRAPSTVKFPAKPVLTKLLGDLSAKYRFLGSKTYKGLRDTQDVFLFNLN